QHVTRPHVAVLDRANGGIAAVVDDRGAFEAILAPGPAQAELHDRALRCERAVQDRDRRLAGKRTRDGANHIVIVHDGIGNVLTDRAPGDRERAAIEQRLELLHERERTARRFELLDRVLTVRAYGAQHRDLSTQLV